MDRGLLPTGTLTRPPSPRTRGQASKPQSQRTAADKNRVWRRHDSRAVQCKPPDVGRGAAGREAAHHVLQRQDGAVRPPARGLPAGARFLRGSCFCVPAISAGLGLCAVLWGPPCWARAGASIPQAPGRSCFASVFARTYGLLGSPCASASDILRQFAPREKEECPHSHRWRLNGPVRC